MNLAARLRLAFLPLAAVGIVLGVSSVSQVDENHQAVVLKGDQAIGVVNRFSPGRKPGSGAGLVFHWPVIERVVMLDRTLVGFEANDKTVETTDGAKLHLDLAGRYRIIDPVRLTGRIGNQDRIAPELEALLAPLIQAEFGRLAASDVPLPGGSGAWKRIAAALDAKSRAYGVQVVDLRVRRAVLGAGTLSATYDRMQQAREQLAGEIGDAGVREAAQIRSETEVEAARIIGESAGRDPEFYDFYRRMATFEKISADKSQKGKTTVILSPGSAGQR
ncbi:MAG: hypothetical protein H6916_12110 [Novosphingobium sp.]|uniref:SPFH domain-containing protein n=1 Tax=Novosphingobium sp. TaxID=1874826 RepID=UPI001D609B32|nr:SPFH domain-containing protein [Novosphingobium sp.]MCB2058826.1 hypothetical protein [Novosphingobium sp.]MCP5387538.1 hypothetical protein [Novosphingobium sp.]